MIDRKNPGTSEAKTESCADLPFVDPSRQVDSSEVGVTKERISWTRYIYTVMASSLKKVAYIENVENFTPVELAEYMALLLGTSKKMLEVVFLYSKLQSWLPLCAAVRMPKRVYADCLKCARWFYGSRRVKVLRREDCKKIDLARWILLADGSQISERGSQHWATQMEAGKKRKHEAADTEGRKFYTWETINTQGGERFCYAAFDCGCMIHQKANYAVRGEDCYDTDLLMERILEAGVQRLILMGISSIRSAERAKACSLSYPEHCRFTVGYHPNYSTSWTEEKKSRLETLARHPLCVAIGECGVDFKSNTVHPDLQYRLLKMQVELACKLRKPLLIYERDLQDVVLEILNQFRDRLPPVAVHTRSWNCDFNLYIQHGCYIIVSGWMFATDTTDTPFFKWLQNAKPWQLDYLLLASGHYSRENYPCFVDKVLCIEYMKVVRFGITRDQYTDQAIDWYTESKRKWQRTTPLFLPALIELTAIGAKLSPAELSRRCLENSQRFFQKRVKLSPAECSRRCLKNSQRSPKGQQPEKKEMRRGKKFEWKSVKAGLYEFGTWFIISFVLTSAVSFAVIGVVEFLRK